jgi:hypothetical protein
MVVMHRAICIITTRSLHRTALHCDALSWSETGVLEHLLRRAGGWSRGPRAYHRRPTTSPFSPTSCGSSLSAGSFVTPLRPYVHRLRWLKSPSECAAFG